MKTFGITELTTSLLKRKLETVFYFDRVHVYFDSRTKATDLGFMKKWHKNNTLLFLRLPHHPQFDKKLELYQPTTKQLQELLDLLQSGIIAGDYVITYIELAIDFRSKNKKLLNKLREFISKHMAYIPKRKRASYSEKEGTSYYLGKDSREQLAVYNDFDKRKHPIKSSIHVEWRFKNTTLVKSTEVYLLNDLVEFDHQGFWQNNLKFYAPNFTVLGKASELFEKTAIKKSDNNKTLINRGKQYWDRLNNLQKFLSKNHKKPCLEKAFLEITTTTTFEKYLSETLDD